MIDALPMSEAEREFRRSEAVPDAELTSPALNLLKGKAGQEVLAGQ